jgi:formate-dependent phosphoribosylglycinamide formyltransferase (GAR transformylase)
MHANFMKPLSPSATKVMLLGNGEPGREVAIALQRFGVEVIAVARYEKPESCKKNRMGVALATGKNTGEARVRTKLAASKVFPVKAS